MAADTLIPAVCVIVGIYNLYLGYKITAQPETAKKYMEAKTPKTYLLNKISGPEKAPKIAQKIFGPAAMMLGLLLIALGAILLIP